MKKSYLIKGALAAISLCATFFSGQAKAQWVEQASGFSIPGTSIFNISAPSATDVWASANSPSKTVNVPYTRSTDGGNTWTASAIPNTIGLQFSSLYALTKDVAWAALFSPTNGGGKIFNTTDGGATWTLQSTTNMFSGTGGFIDFVYFFDANNGVAVGDPVGGAFEIYTTTNGGTNWTAVSSSNIPAPQGKEYGVVNDYAAVGNNIWFGTSIGNVYRSGDKGLTWTVSSSGLQTTNQVIFKDAIHGIANNFGTISQTKDGGQTWTTVQTAGLPVGGDIAYIAGTASTYACIYPGGSSYSPNDGNFPWISMATNINFANGIAFANATAGWCGGINATSTKGGIYKWTGLPSVSVGIFYAAVCTNLSFKLPYIVNATFNTGNIFTAELSDANGNFANPIVIGTKTATGSDTILVKIPANTPNGGGYRIRIRASNSAFVSPDNGYNVYVGTNVYTQPVDQIICAPTTTATFNVGAIGKGNNISYQWQVSNGKGFDTLAVNSVYSGVSSAMLSVVATPGLAGNKYRCRLIGACGDTAISKIVNLYTGATSLASITTQPADQTICIGGTANFDVVVSNSSGYEYQWQYSIDGVTYYDIQGQTSSYFIFNNVTYANNNIFIRCKILSCGGAVVNSNSAKLIIIPYLSSPIPTITLNGNVLTSSATTGNQWYKDGVLITGASGKTYIITSNGVYKVVVQDPNSCNVQSNSMLVNTTGIAEQTFLCMHLSLTPNPSKGSVIIAGLSGKSIVNVVSITGQLLHQETTVNAELQINLEYLPKGLYLIQVIDSKQSATEKLIIE